MITVKIIVTGLLTVVRHTDDAGSTVLLRDAWTEHMSGQETSAGTLGVHIPILLLLKGSCQSGCVGWPAGMDPQLADELIRALRPNAPPELGLTSPVGEIDLNNVIPSERLLWIPAGRDLYFPQLATRLPSNETTNRSGAFRLREGWMNTAEVEPNCLHGPALCTAAITRLTARPASTDTACFVKDRSNSANRDAAFKIGRRSGKTTGWINRRLKEHHVLEFSIPRDHLVLRGDALGGAPSIEASILPADREIVLFLGNIFLGDCIGTPVSSHHDHYASLYAFSSEGVPEEKGRIPVWVDNGGLAPKTDPQCEQIEDLLPGFASCEDAGRMLYYPNNPARCPPGSTIDQN